MNPSYQPTGWLDLIPYFLIAVPSVITAVLGVKNMKLNKLRHKENRGHIEELKYEITNDHSSNIRHDIDAIHELVSDGFTQLRRDIGAVQGELRAERRERIEADRLIQLIRGE
ncbi:hypothetical protein SEA_ACOLYTE_30 [Mycobacterium phage Acolyte]|nr:hypothetical protein SEA_ACOLYTE_30 [Mycobacterium phage Acolyte]